MANFPKFVEFREEGPREGFQIEKRIYPLADRAALIDALSETGVKRIQVGSFVSARNVPTMADTAELFAAIRRKPGIAYTGLWLNAQGFARAQATPGVELDPRLLFYASNRFSMQNNNLPALEMRERQRAWLDLYLAHGLELDAAYVMAAFGCNMEGDIPLERVMDDFRWIVDLCREKSVPLPNLYLADTMGWANPDSMKRAISRLREIAPEARVGLHLHDTRGLGIANVHAALEMGVDLFDSSVAGLGGCPFAGHGDSTAAGNVCTEDAVFLCHELGIETGIDLDALIAAARLAERILGRPLMGRVMHSGGLTRRSGLPVS